MTRERTGDHLLTRLADDDRELLRTLGTLAEGAGTSAYVVGGVVRDLMRDLPNIDLDVVVEGDALAFAETAADELGGSVKAHTRFGTVILVLPGGRKIDLATARSEVYERPGALPTVTPGPMESDLRRRDFTINAMAIALDPDRFGELLDPFGGEADLEGGVLRSLTEVSFEDDPTRILRGVRFSARYGLTIEPSTEALLRRAVEERRTDTVSGERLLNEIELILRESDPWPPVFRLIDWGVLRSMVEGWDVPLSVRRTFVEVERLTERRASDERWKTLFLTLLAPVTADTRAAVAERLASGRRIRELVAALTTLVDEVLLELRTGEEPASSSLYEMLSRFPDEALTVARASATDSPAEARIRRYVAELRDVRTTLSGADLRDMGVPEGPLVGEILAALLCARLDGEVTSDEEERELAERLAGESPGSLTNGARVDSVAPEPAGPERPGEPGTPEGPETAGQTTPRTEEMTHEEVLETQTEPDAGAESAPEDSSDVRNAVSDEAPRAGSSGSTAAAVATAEARPLVNRPVYEVRLDAFEGPLDLLLHLIREHEIDIYDIPIAVITEQYLEYISFMESLDLALAGEFLEMAATLIRIKVQMLLPKETDETEVEDPREQLVRKLVEYKQFKEVAGRLSEQETERRDHFPRGVDPRTYADTEEEQIDLDEFLRDVTLFDLVDSLREVLSRVPERVDVHAVDKEEVTVEEQIDRIRAVVRERGSLPFIEVFGESASRFMIISTFIALLELIRLGEVLAIQKRNFGDIEIQARVED